MEDESKTSDGRRRWRQWTEEQARAALEDLAQSGLSLGKYAAFKGISVRRLAYWRTRLAESGSPRFVGVEVSTARTATEGRIEIVVGDVTVRVREQLDADRVARLVEALARRHREC